MTVPATPTRHVNEGFTAATNARHWPSMHRPIWGHHDWPRDAQLVVSRLGGRGMHPQAPHCHPSDVDGLLAKIGASDFADGNVYLNVAPMTGVTGTSRGGRDNAIALPALFVDVDVDEAGHKSVDLPSWTQADEMIASYPLRPTVVVRTGGGYHVWYALDDLLVPGDDGDQDVLDCHKAWWVDEAARRGVGIDDGVLADWARCLRPVGTTRRKGGTEIAVEMVHLDETARYSRLDVLDLVPVPEPDPTLAAVPSPNGSPPSRDAFEGDSAANRFSVEVALESLLFALGFRPAGSGWVDPESTSSAPSMQTYDDDDGYRRVYIYGDAALARLGLGDDARSLRACDLLAAAMDGDGDGWSRVVRVARHFDPSGGGGRWDELVAAVGDQVDDLAGWADSITPATALTTAASDDALTVWDVVAGEPGTVQVPVGEGWTADVGGPSTGIWRWVEREKQDGTVDKIRSYATDWVPVVTRQRAFVGHDGAVDEDDKQYDVAVVRGGGSTLHATNMSAADAFSPAKVVERIGGGVSLPSSRPATTAVRNAASVIGYDDRPTDHRYLTMGWHTDPVSGESIYVGGRSIIRLDRVDQAQSLVSSRSSHSQSTGLAAAVGWDEPLRDDGDENAALDALGMLTHVSPDDPVIGATMVGATMASLLGLPKRTTVVLQGATSKGKSLVTRMPLAYLAPGADALHGKACTVHLPSLGADSTTKGVMRVVAQFAHMPVDVDDLKATAGSGGVDRQALAMAHGVVSALAQGAYGAGDAVKGTQDGGYRAIETHQSVPIVSAEIMPVDPAIANRSILLSIDDHGVDLARGTGRIDQFRKVARAGVQQRHWVSLVQHLMGDDARDYDSWSQDRAASRGGDRAAEHVAVIAAGWRLLYDLHGEHHPKLPEPSQVKQWVGKLFTKVSKEHGDRDLASQITSIMLDAVAGGRAYLRASEGRVPPDGIAARVGWRRIAGYMGSDDWKTNPRAIELGEYGPDEPMVLVSRQGLRDLLATHGLDGLGAEQVSDAIRDMRGPGPESDERSELKGKAPKSGKVPWLGKYPRGYLVPVGCVISDDCKPPLEAKSHSDSEQEPGGSLGRNPTARRR